MLDFELVRTRSLTPDLGLHPDPGVLTMSTWRMLPRWASRRWRLHLPTQSHHHIPLLREAFLCLPIIGLWIA